MNKKKFQPIFPACPVRIITINGVKYRFRPEKKQYGKSIEYRIKVVRLTDMTIVKPIILPDPPLLITQEDKWKYSNKWAIQLIEKNFQPNAKKYIVKRIK